MKAIDERIDDLAAQPEVLLAYLAGQTNQPLNYDGSKFWVMRKGDEITIRTITGNTKRTIHIESKEDNTMSIELSRETVYDIILKYLHDDADHGKDDTITIESGETKYDVRHAESNTWEVYEGETKLFIFGTDFDWKNVKDDSIFYFSDVKLTGKWPDPTVYNNARYEQIDPSIFDEPIKEGFAQDINSEEPTKEEQVKEEVEAPFTPAEEPKAKWGLGKKVLVGAAVVGTVAAVGYGAWKLANKLTEQIV